MQRDKDLNPRPRLDRTRLNEKEDEHFQQLFKFPIKVLQIGEGNFLRGFFDWMIHRLNKKGLFLGSIAVTQPRPSGASKLAEIKAQDGLYHQIINGIQDGINVEEIELISVFSQMIDPYQEWEKFLGLADNPNLEIVVSNTTEAGLVYQKSMLHAEVPILSYPGKLTFFLYRRFLCFSGDPTKGLLLLPLELVERNGDSLKNIVLQHLADWGLPESFKNWLLTHNHFLNSLVDRIVTGYPDVQSGNLHKNAHLEDSLLNVAEPYYFWAIEGNTDLDKRLPLRQAGLNAHWVEDLQPYQLRKVRLLNGAHSILASIGLLNGFNEVREVVEHPVFGPIIRKAMLKEIVPAIPLDPFDMELYAEEVWIRFRNPYIHHKLTDIATNSLSKFKIRIFPSLIAYRQLKVKLPPIIVESLASLIILYRIKKANGKYIGKRLNGEEIAIKDDFAALDSLAFIWDQFDQGVTTLEQTVCNVLQNQHIWGQNLTEIPGLEEAILAKIIEWEWKNNE